MKGNYRGKIHHSINRGLVDKELISIVIPIYNTEKYLERCIESVIEQEYKNLDIILVNDGSLDRTGEICDNYAKKDRRIQVIHKKNGGLSDARNVGILNSKGKYIAFIDSDDFISPRYVRKLWDSIHRYNADIAICGYEIGKKNKFNWKKRCKDQIYCFDAKEMLSKWHGRFKRLETIAWNKLYKKSLFVDNEIYYPLNYYNEDVQTTHLIVNKSKKIVIITAKLYYYFQREGSIVKEKTNKAIKDSIYSQEARLIFFEKNNYQETYQRLAIKLQKYCMLMYCRVKDYEIKKELMRNFKEQNTIVKKFRSLRFREKILFFLFGKYYFVFEKIFIFLGVKNG